MSLEVHEDDMYDDDEKNLNKLDFKTTKEKRYYYWYLKKVNRAYPYAKLAADRLIQLW